MANNSLCYYSYRGESFGFEYELMQEFARRKGLNIELQVMDNWNEMMKAVQEKKADIIAANMRVTDERKKRVLFTKPHLYDREVVVINRKEKGIQLLKDLHETKVSLIRSSFSAEGGFTHSLKQRFPDMRFEELSSRGMEEVLEEIADGKREATIVPSLMYKVNRRYFPSIKSVGVVSQTLRFAWAVRKGNNALKEELEQFLQDALHDGYYKKVYEAYFDHLDLFYRLNIKKFRIQYRNRFQAYKTRTMKEAAKWGIDWRLIAAQMFQESHFSSKAQSNRGAFGLMQLMPTTMRDLKVRNRRDPNENIRAGIQYIGWLKEQFHDFPEDQQELFALAAYNVGIHHLWDAIKLARLKGLDEKQWMNVRETLSLLTQKEYYRKAEYGYCNARETLSYVSNIMMYYDILRRENLDPVELKSKKKEEESELKMQGSLKKGDQ